MSISFPCRMNNRTYALALFSEVIGSFTPESTNPNALVDRLGRVPERGAGAAGPRA
jgi:hypothetical protein